MVWECMCVYMDVQLGSVYMYVCMCVYMSMAGWYVCVCVVYMCMYMCVSTVKW